jgi:hypothetical protein
MFLTARPSPFVIAPGHARAIHFPRPNVLPSIPMQAVILSMAGDHAAEQICGGIVLQGVGTFLVWCLLLVFSWPLALLALIVYPFVWILLIPFRIVGIAVDGTLGLVGGLVMLPARLLRGARTG